MSEYRIIKLLGEGSFGKCYLCENQRDQSMVVIKEINLQSLSEAERREALGEAKVLEALKHSNIITFREVYKTRQNKLCIVMDYADGGDLAGKVKAQRGVHFSENQILDWFIQIALALKHVHDRKVLHRDIKTQNVFLMKNGTVKMGDFGIAKVLKSTREIARTMVGTPYYLSPEIIENKPYSFKSDVWSLGVLLYELCALRPPFDGTGLPQLYMKIVRGNFSPIPPQFSKDLKTLVAQMLSVDVGRRPTVNQILRQPFIKSRIRNYLSSSVSEAEFNHTVLHNQYLFDRKEEKKEEVKREFPKRVQPVEEPQRRIDSEPPRRLPEPEPPRRLPEPEPPRQPDPPRRLPEPDPPRRLPEAEAPRRFPDPEPRRPADDIYRPPDPKPPRPEIDILRRVEPELPKPVPVIEPLRRQDSDGIKPKPVDIRPRWKEEGEARNLLSPRYELRPEPKPVVYQPPKPAAGVPADRPPAAVYVPPKKDVIWEKPSKVIEEQRKKREMEEEEQARKLAEQQRVRQEKEEKRKQEHAKMLEDKRKQGKDKPNVQVMWPGMDKLKQELVEEMQSVLDDDDESEAVHEPIVPNIPPEDEDRVDILAPPPDIPEPRPVQSEPLDDSPAAGIEGLRGYLIEVFGQSNFEAAYKVVRDIDPSKGRAELSVSLLGQKLRGIVDVERNKQSVDLLQTLIYIECLEEERAKL